MSIIFKPDSTAAPPKPVTRVTFASPDDLWVQRAMRCHWGESDSGGYGVICSVGAKNSGKTFLHLAAIREGMISGRIDKLILVAPNILSEQKGSYSVFVNGPRQKDVIAYTWLTPDVKKKLGEFQDAGHRVAIFIDDGSTMPLFYDPFMYNFVLDMAVNSRHKSGLWLHLALHMVKGGLPTAVRSNVDCFILHPAGALNERTIRAYWEENCSRMIRTYEAFNEMCTTEQYHAERPVFVIDARDPRGPTMRWLDGCTTGIACPNDLKSAGLQNVEFAKSYAIVAAKKAEEEQVRLPPKSAAPGIAGSDAALQMRKAARERLLQLLNSP